MRFLRGLTLVAAIATLSATTVRADVVVDAFTVAQTTMATAPGLITTTASGAGILGGTRTMSVFLDPANPTPPFALGFVNTGSGFLSGTFTNPNIPPGGSYFDLLYNVASTDVSGGVTPGFKFSASSQTGSTIKITANGTSTATVLVPDGASFTNYFITLASFSDPTVFTHLTSVDIKATFPNAAGSGPSLTINTPIIIAAIPEPSVLALGSVACVILGGLRLRRKNQS